MSVFLIGGGWNTETFPQTYKRFLQAATVANQNRIAIIVAEEDIADAHEHFSRFRGAFESIGLNSTDAFKVVVSAENPLSLETLHQIQPTGIFVCGGLTPSYYDALCLDKQWLEYLTENKIPYCGFSAGASIASKFAVIGGWRRKISDKIVAIADENAGEDLDFLDVRSALGLIPFAVDVHATQWGTLTRLIHAIDAKAVREGWAIDENTMLEVNDKTIGIYGAGNAYHLHCENEKITVDIFQADQFEELK